MLIRGAQRLVGGLALGLNALGQICLTSAPSWLTPWSRAGGFVGGARCGLQPAPVHLRANRVFTASLVEV